MPVSRLTFFFLSLFLTINTTTYAQFLMQCQADGYAADTATTIVSAGLSVAGATDDLVAINSGRQLAYYKYSSLTESMAKTILAGETDADAASTAATFRDGPGFTARFVGITHFAAVEFATFTTGAVYFVDGGTRVRYFNQFDGWRTQPYAVTIDTLAGGSAPSDGVALDGVGASASFMSIQGIAANPPTGTPTELFVSDQHCVRRIQISGRVVSTYMGTCLHAGSAGSAGSPVNNVLFNTPGTVSIVVALALSATLVAVYDKGNARIVLQNIDTRAHFILPVDAEATALCPLSDGSGFVSVLGGDGCRVTWTETTASEDGSLIAATSRVVVFNLSVSVDKRHQDGADPQAAPRSLLCGSPATSCQSFVSSKVTSIWSRRPGYPNLILDGCVANAVAALSKAGSPDLPQVSPPPASGTAEGGNDVAVIVGILVAVAVILGLVVVIGCVFVRGGKDKDGSKKDGGNKKDGNYQLSNSGEGNKPDSGVTIPASPKTKRGGEKLQGSTLTHSTTTLDPNGGSILDPNDVSLTQMHHSHKPPPELMVVSDFDDMMNQDGLGVASPHASSTSMSESKRHKLRRQYILNGDYRRGRLLGRGAVGSVYVAILGDGSAVAMKEVNLTGSKSDMQKQVDLVKAEISLLANLEHQAIVAYYGVTCDDSIGQVKLFMELVTGGSLGEMSRELEEPMEESVAKRYMKQVLSGLAYLHANGVMHRDLKGDNILVTHDTGVVKIADFGTARSVGNNTMAARGATTMVGTPYFMAPEILVGQDGEEGYGTKADVWSFGIMVLEILNNGNAPWPVFTNPAQLFIHIADERALPTISRRLSPEGEDFVSHCTARDPKARWSAEELLAHPWFANVE